MTEHISFNNGAGNIYQNSYQLERPRVKELLKNAINNQMVVVCAGSGYGKTREVYSFLHEYEACVIWMQLSERDNVVPRFWENFTHVVSLTWPDVGERFMNLGFPETEEALAIYKMLRNETIANLDKYILVYDDFHLLHNPVLLHFVEEAASSLTPNGTVVIISRTMPDVGMLGIMMSERIFLVREDSLCFTEEEIALYFNQLGILATRQDIRDIYEDTQGWAFAVNLIGRSLLKEAKYMRSSLEAMKENIFKLIDSEIMQYYSEPLCNFLLRISLLDNHTASLIRSINDDEELIKGMEQLNAYIRYDYYLGTYMIHHILLDYLKQKQHILTEAEKRDTYKKAGQWSENNDYISDALSYYIKACDYDAVLRLIYSLNLLPPLDMAKYASEILDLIPKEAASDNPLFPAMLIKLKMGLGLLDEASALARQYSDEYEARPESPEKNHGLAEIYGIWAVLRMIMCPYTGEFDFDIYFKKQHEYYEKSPYEASGPVTNQPIGAYVLLLGTNRAGAPEEYINALSRAIPHSSYVLKGSLYGLDDLARGEINFYQRNLDIAEQYMRQAQEKALARKQYDIQHRATQYQMLITLSRGDIDGAQKILKQLETFLDIKEYAMRYETYDIAAAHYYLVIGQPEQLADWLKGDFSQYAHPAFLENYANRIKAQYRYLTRRHNELLAFLENMKDNQKVLFGRIVFDVLRALSLYQLKRKDEALSALAEAYELAAPNKIVTPFTQYTKDMRTLTSAALKDEKCRIPKEWLEDINRKASAFAKRTAHMESQYKNTYGIVDEITLSKREAAVLRELSQGLSRSEIAASQNISINTVKMVINIIYDKLNVTSLPEAIRIALEKKMI